MAPMSRSSRRSWWLSADGQIRRRAAAAAMAGEVMAVGNRRSRRQPAGLSWAARRMSPRLWSPGSAGLPVPAGSWPGRWPGAGPSWPVMVMPCSRATWVRNRHGAIRYATRAQLVMEERMLAQADARGAPHLTHAQAAHALGADPAQLDAA